LVETAAVRLNFHRLLHPAQFNTDYAAATTGPGGIVASFSPHNPYSVLRNYVNKSLCFAPTTVKCGPTSLCSSLVFDVRLVLLKRVGRDSSAR
jgi:hypothetical protein